MFPAGPARTDSPLTDQAYTNHLNAKNPFTGEQVPEPGRVFFADLTYAF